MAVGMIGAAFAMNFKPLLSAPKFIPVMGMLYGNTMVGVALGIDTVLSTVDLRRDSVEAMMCYGASQWETVLPIAVDAARTAMLPTITSLSITGLIAIPGMMSGQILGGADVLNAARYQQVIMFMIAACVALGVVFSVIYVAFAVIDSCPRLHTDNIQIKLDSLTRSYSVLTDTGDGPNKPDIPDNPVTWENVGLAAVLLGFNVVLSVWFGLGLSASLVIAAVRCVVQLTVLGLVLKQIFLTDNPVFIFGMTLVLGILAAFEVTYWRAKRQFPWMFAGTLVFITTSAVGVSLFGNAYALNMTPAYTAVRFIPTVGMTFGKCMIGVSIGMGTAMDSLDSNRDRVEATLCYGASRWEATKPVVVDALRSALLPTITNMSITGLISIPGMMTGWILGGSDVQEAARYQQIILFMISAAVASSTLLSVLFCVFTLVDKAPRLRLDRLTDSGVSQHVGSVVGESGDVNSRPRSSQRLERLRSGSSTDNAMDIEDAARQCRMVCGKTGREWQPAKDGVPASEYICAGAGDGRWKGNWCACCPYRPKHEFDDGSKMPVQCYGYQEDPGDIVIPHPPALVGAIAVSSMNSLPANNSHGVSGSHDGYASRARSTQGRGMNSHQVFDRDAVGDQIMITTSLLDPHPIIIPPPGSRLAFPGATSREATHTFRSLPSLEDTLLRRAREPLCLFSYWEYLLDVEGRPAELEFWLSLSDYEVLYRRYANLRSPSIGPVSGDNTHDGSHIRTMGPIAKRLRYGRVESGALGAQSMSEAVAGSGGKATLAKRKSGPIDNLDTEAQELDAYLATLSYQTAIAAKNSNCQIHVQCRSSHRPFTSAHVADRPTLDAPKLPRQRSGLSGFFSRIFSGEPRVRTGGAIADSQHQQHEEAGGAHQEVPLLASQTGEGDPKDDMFDTPTEEEMRRAAERLYFHYFLSDAPAELCIGQQMREEIAMRIERDNRIDSDLFAPAKRHVYEAMHSESYLRFLRERLYHNITRGTAAPRIALGLSLIFVALVFQFSLIFLDVKPKGWRWLPLAALWPGFAYAFAGVSRLDPFMALLGRYEATAWRFERVRDPAIHDKHLKKGSMHLIYAAAVAAIITLVLFLVPGHHL
ncbi:hypothetical protein EV175_001787 [Coemansia sp. RSA 1933]|nr:hypothetical protein EV175_001787 [Coemansia sp. RSA 1933]